MSSSGNVNLKNGNVTINGNANVSSVTNGNTGSNGNTNWFTTFLQMLNQSNAVLLLWFLVIYVVIYLLISIFRSGTSSNSIVRVFDIVAIGFLLIYLLMTFFQESEADKEMTMKNYYLGLEAYMNNPMSLFSIGIFILVLYTIIFMLGIPMESGLKPVTVILLEYGAWILFVLVLISSFFKYVLGISITNLMDQALGFLQKQGTQAQAQSTTTATATTTATTSNSNVSSGGSSDSNSGNSSSKNSTVEMNEVFNIANNMYTYEDAQSICTSYGAKLATYDQVEDAYNNGAEWCNYGWSENQSVYFPTQKSTWDTLQKTTDQKNACGRPGVNGGYMDDPKLRFGVNCYGKKPLPTPAELAALNQPKSVPQSEEDMIMDMKVQFWKDNADKILQINSYNSNKWSEY
jgi:hypothetical protein